jgi:hypothetical protein
MRCVTLHAWLLLALAQASGSRAEACSPADGYSLAAMVPADGAGGVPLNAYVRLTYWGDPAGVPTTGFEDVILQPVGGMAVPLTVGTTSLPGAWTITVRPIDPLLPMTTYQVLSAYKATCVTYSDCTAPGRELVGTFTTGNASDVTPPTFAGIEGVTTRVEICESSACCGPFRGIAFTFSWTEASDDTGVVGYRLHKDGVPIADNGARGGMLICSGEDHFVSGGAVFRGSGTYAVHAFDVAGNEDSNAATLALKLDCADTIQADGGTDAAGDGSGGTGSQSKGCAVGRPATAGLAGSCLLVALLAGARRGRRRPAGAGHRRR